MGENDELVAFAVAMLQPSATCTRSAGPGPGEPGTGSGVPEAPSPNILLQYFCSSLGYNGM